MDEKETVKFRIAEREPSPLAILHRMSADIVQIKRVLQDAGAAKQESRWKDRLFYIMIVAWVFEIARTVGGFFRH